MADLKASPRNKLLGLLADSVQGASDWASENNPPVRGLLGLLGVPAVSNTLNELSYGGALGTGSGMTWKPKADTMDAAMVLAPMAAATKGMPVGLSIKSVDEGGLLAALAKKKFVYPQEAALELAQKNASLPFEQGGLGLPATNTAADRARAMGFQTAPSKTTFHATRDDVSGAIDPSKSDFGFHTGTLEQAEARIKSRSPTGTTYPDGANVMPLMMDKYANLLKVVDEGSFHADALAPQLAKKGIMDKSKAKDLVKKLEGDWMEKMEPKYDQQMRDIVKQNGYDGLKYANAQEGDGISYAFSNPSVLRSRFAAFDPMRRNSPDLLAGMLPFSTMADEDVRNELSRLLTK